jgi:hypothetical protein
MDRGAARQAALDALAEADAVLGGPSDSVDAVAVAVSPVSLEEDPAVRASVTDVTIEVHANVSDAVAQEPDVAAATSPLAAPQSIFFDSTFQRHNATRASVFGTHDVRSRLHLSMFSATFTR